MADSQAMGKGPGWKTVPVPVIVIALLWLVGMSLICLGVLAEMWPHPTPGGTVPGASGATGTTGTTGTTGATGTTGTTQSEQSALAFFCKGNDDKYKDECDCWKRVAAEQGIYYKDGQKSPDLKDDPSCIHFWAPFDLVNRWTLMWGETRLLLIVMICGFIGAMIYAIRSILWYVGHRSLLWSWLAMYIVVPIVGSLMAVVFYLVLRGGLFSPSTPVSSTSPFGFAAIAALVGMFIQQSAEKLKKIFETVMTTAAQGGDTVSDNVTQKPQLPTVTNVTATAGATTITVAGENFTSAAQVLNNGTAIKETKFDNEKQLTGTLDAALKSGDKLSITVKDTAGTSTAVEVSVT